MSLRECKHPTLSAAAKTRPGVGCLRSLTYGCHDTTEETGFSAIIALLLIGYILKFLMSGSLFPGGFTRELETYSRWTLSWDTSTTHSKITLMNKKLFRQQESPVLYVCLQASLCGWMWFVEIWGSGAPLWELLLGQEVRVKALFEALCPNRVGQLKMLPSTPVQT